MRVAIVIKFTYNSNFYSSRSPSFEFDTVDTIVKLDCNEDEETLEDKIMKKYPNLNEVKYETIVYDTETMQEYVIVCSYI